MSSYFNIGMERLKITFHCSEVGAVGEVRQKLDSHKVRSLRRRRVHSTTTAEASRHSRGLVSINYSIATLNAVTRL